MKLNALPKNVDQVISAIDECLINWALEHKVSMSEAVASEEFQKELGALMGKANTEMVESESEFDEGDCLLDACADYLECLATNLKEDETTSEKEDEKSDDEKGNDSSEDGNKKEDVDETELQTKHGKTKMQSILDRKAYKHDFKLKRKNKLRAKLRDARGGRAKDLKLSKKVKKAFNVKHLGKRWESENEADDEEDQVSPDKKDEKNPDGKDTKDIKKKKDESCGSDKKENCNGKDCEEGEDCDGKDCKESVQEKLLAAIKVEESVIKEAIADSLVKIEAFGTMNESDSSAIKSVIETTILEQVNDRANKMAEILVKTTDEYLENELMPMVEENLKETIENEIIPEMDEELNDYLNYMAEDIADRMMAENRVMKSKKAEMVESFADKLLSLIKEELKIMPEQEDELEANQKQIAYLESTLDSNRRAKVKLQDELFNASKKIYMLESMPKDASDNQKETIMAESEKLDGKTFEAFKEQADALIANVIKGKDTKEDIKESEEQKKTEDIQKNALNSVYDIVNRALQLA